MQRLLIHDISANCQKDRTVIFWIFVNILMNNTVYETRSISIDSPYNLLQNDVYTYLVEKDFVVPTRFKKRKKNI
jgi:hypothetical protein